MRNKDVGLPCNKGPIGSDFRFNERLTYLSRRFSVFLLGFRWFSHQNSYLKTLKPRFSPWWHSFLPVTQFYDIAAQLTQNALEEHFILYILCSNMACRVHSIEYNLRSFFLLFLPPFPSSPNFHTLHHQHWGRRVLLMQKQEEFIWALPAKIEPPCPQRMGKGRVDWTLHPPLQTCCEVKMSNIAEVAIHKFSLLWYSPSPLQNAFPSW